MGHEAQPSTEQKEYIESRNPAAPMETCQRTLGTLGLNIHVHTYWAGFVPSLFSLLLCSISEAWLNSQSKPSGRSNDPAPSSSAPCSHQFIAECSVLRFLLEGGFLFCAMTSVIKLHWSFSSSSIQEQAKAKKQTPPSSPSTQPAEQKTPSSPVYQVCENHFQYLVFDGKRGNVLTQPQQTSPVPLQDAVSCEAEPAYKNSSTTYPAAHEPEPGYKAAESDYQEAVSQREAEYEPETVYEVAGAADHYQAGRAFVSDMKPFEIKIVSLGIDFRNSCAVARCPDFLQSDETF